MKGMMQMTEKRKVSLARAGELKKDAIPYEEAKRHIFKGTGRRFTSRYQKQKEQILTLLGAGEEEWADWRWQLQNRIEHVELLRQILKLSEKEEEEIRQVSVRYRWAITPYYLALIDPENSEDAVRRIAIPTGLELDGSGKEDPMDEEHTNPAGAVTRRYPDRLIINVTNACGMFCRHCQRRRRIGENDRETSEGLLHESVEYIRSNPEIRDVLITGGDPFALEDDFLEGLLFRLREIPHVEIIRIGTRTPVTMPQRITSELVNMLKRYHPIYVNTQFNHPQELTREAIEACSRMADTGVVLGNQMVLLEGVNNDKYVVRLLNHELLRARVRPYYIFHAKQVVGTEHFRTSVDDGIEIMEYLRGHTSGLAVPTYIINAPGGLGKTPVLPEYLLEKNNDMVRLRTWEGKEFWYPNRPSPLDGSAV